MVRPTALLAGLSLAVAPTVAVSENQLNHRRFANSSQCTGPCFVDGPSHSWIQWQSATPTHIVAATLVYIIDNGTNITSTSTISLDTTALLGNGRIYPPQPTNAAGTVVTTITFSGAETVLYVIQSSMQIQVRV